MTKQILYIFGSGGHARVILSEILEFKKFNQIIFVESDKHDKNQVIIDNIKYEVINNLNNLNIEKSYGIIGIGDIAKRRSIAGEIDFKIPDFKWTTIISKNATIAKDVKINHGTVVVAGSIINTGTKIGKHCIINTRTTIEHDNLIGDFVNINPSVVTGGTVTINNESEIGIGAVVKNNILINENVIIGGNSFVNKDCLSNSLYYGNPIRKIK